jgi:hypothetical protein
MIVGITGMQIGRKAGIIHVGPWVPPIPTFVPVYVRRNIFMELMGPMLDGSRP